jgi:uncharacterized protein DUF1573
MCRFRFRLRTLLLAVAITALMIGAMIEVRRGTGPRALVVGSPVFDFGTMPQRSGSNHAWLIWNRGRSPLVLERGPSSPDCAILAPVAGESMSVPAGGRATITVVWDARACPYNGQRAILLTNDPEKPSIELRVRGVTTPTVRPPDRR